MEPVGKRLIAGRLPAEGEHSHVGTWESTTARQPDYRRHRAAKTVADDIQGHAGLQAASEKLERRLANRAANAEVRQIGIRLSETHDFAPAALIPAATYHMFGPS